MNTELESNGNIDLSKLAPEAEWRKMKAVIDIGLKKVETEIKSTRKIKKGIDVVEGTMKMVAKVVIEVPHASLAWAGVSLGLQVRAQISH